jgi:hypothetical protein
LWTEDDFAALRFKVEITRLNRLKRNRYRLMTLPGAWNIKNPPAPAPGFFRRQRRACHPKRAQPSISALLMLRSGFFSSQFV